jgi:hypothetical protein
LLYYKFSSLLWESLKNLIAKAKCRVEAQLNYLVVGDLCTCCRAWTCRAANSTPFENLSWKVISPLSSFVETASSIHSLVSIRVKSSCCVACLLGGPSRQQKQNAAACLCFLNYLTFHRLAADRTDSILSWVVSRGRSHGFLSADSSVQKVRNGDSTPAYTRVSDRRRLTVLVKVRSARRVQAPAPQICEPNSQENQIIEARKEVGCAVSTQETAARREWEIYDLTHDPAPWTNDRPHPRIVK